MLRSLNIVLIIRLLVLLEPEACSAVPHDLSNDYSDHYYASKGEEFEALKFEFSEYVQHLKDGDTLKAAGLVTSKRCIAAAKSELNRKKNKCLNPFEMKQFDRPKVHDVALKLPVWFSEVSLLNNETLLCHINKFLLASLHFTGILPPSSQVPELSCGHHLPSLRKSESGWRKALGQER